jgi:hypothetical protein
MVRRGSGVRVPASALGTAAFRGFLRCGAACGDAWKVGRGSGVRVPSSASRKDPQVGHIARPARRARRAREGVGAGIGANVSRSSRSWGGAEQGEPARRALEGNSVVGGTAVALALGAFLDASLGLAAAMGSTAAIVSVIGWLRYADRLLDASAPTPSPCSRRHLRAAQARPRPSSC